MSHMKWFRATVLALVTIAAATAKSADLVLDGSTPIDPAVWYDSVTVTTPSVSGGPLHVANGGVINVSVGATLSCQIVVGQSDSGNVRLASASGVSAVFSGVISGPAPIKIDCADVTGSVTFSGANTFDGKLTIAKGSFHAVGDGAFGSTDGTTYFLGDSENNSGNTIYNAIYFDGLTTSEEIELSHNQNKTGARGNNIFFTADCTFNGAVKGLNNQSEYGWVFYNGITVNFNGSFSGFGSFVGHNRSYYTPATSTATLNFNCAPSISGTWYLSSTTNNYNHPVTCGGNVYQYDGTHNLFCADVFNGKQLTIGEKTYDYVMNLVTGDQHLKNIIGANSVGTTTAKAVIYSQNGNTLHISAGAVTDYRGKFSGNVNVSIDGSGYTTTFSGASDTTGTLTLTNGGCLTLASGANWVGETSLPTDQAGAETLTLNCGRIVVSNLVVAGVSKPVGVYGSSTSSAPAANQLGCLAGDGTIEVYREVVYTEDTWTGGDSESANITSGQNWASGSEPPYDDGSTTVRISAGESADVSHDVFWRQLEFLSSGLAAFRFFGAGDMSFADGIAIDAPEAGGVRDYEIATSMSIVKSIDVTVPASTRLKLSGNVSGATGADVDANVDGFLELSGANSFAGAMAVSGTGVVSAVTSTAFGSNVGETSFSGSNMQGAEGNPLLDMQGITTYEPFVFDGISIQSSSAVTNVFAGKVTMKNKATFFNSIETGTRYEFTGGIDIASDSGNIVQFRVGNSESTADAEPRAAIVIKDRPFNHVGQGAFKFYNMSRACDVIFAVSSNKFAKTGGVTPDINVMTYRFCADGTPAAKVLCAAPFAFNYDARLCLGYATTSSAYCGHFDLGGYDQGFASAFGWGESYQSAIINGKTIGSYSVISSSTAAQLCSRHADEAKTWWTFSGAAGYRMEGSGSITFMTDSDTCGELTVTNGTMSVAAGVKWRNCPKITVSGSGTFNVSDEGAFDKKIALDIRDQGVVYIPEGVVLRVKNLYLDGSDVPVRGEWGSAASSAAKKSARFSGSGRVYAGPSGLLLYFR